MRNRGELCSATDMFLHTSARAITHLVRSG